MQVEEYYLGIDWGEKRIGLALGDSLLKLALPFKTVSDLKDVLELIRQEQINFIVLGQPQKMSGAKVDNKAWQHFYQNLTTKTKVPIILQDERLSSKAVDALAGRKKSSAGRDELAATIILQAYFDKH